MSLDNEQSKVIQGRFHLTRKLGAGSFGEIFEAKDLKTGKLYACKAESLRTKHPQLRLEYQIYRALQNSKSFVRVWGYVTHYNHQIMIMDKLGDSLEQLFTLCGRKFSIRCVCAIAIQILTRIEELHKHNYLHRDIKPDNFLIGHSSNGESGQSSLTSKEAGKVYMIDLGLGKVWKEGGRHIPEKHGKRLIGTPRYASINTHFGHEQSRRDDLESLGYMLMYFAHGQLPWQGLRGQTKEEKYQKIGHKKRDTRLSELCNGYPDEFRQYLSATQKLSFQQDPPYETYRSWFRNVLKRHTNHSAFDFDWQNRNNHTNNKQKVQRKVKNSNQNNKYQTPQPAMHTMQQANANHNNINKIATNMIINNSNQNVNNNNRMINGRNNNNNRGYPTHAHAQTHAQTHTHTHNNHTHTRTHKQPHTTTQYQPPNHTNTGYNNTNNQNNNPLALPNLGQSNTNNIPNNIPMNITPNVQQNQFSNYIDRYQRCRNMLTQQQHNQHNHHTHNKHNQPPNNNNNNNNTNNPILQQMNANKPNNNNNNNNNTNNTTAQLLFPPNNNPRNRPQYGHNPNISKSFVNEYQELVTSYKKLESQATEYKRMWQVSESKYKKEKQKCDGYVQDRNSYAYQLSDAQQTIVTLTNELNAYRQAAINNPHAPAHKRRKLNNGMQRRGSNHRL